MSKPVLSFPAFAMRMPRPPILASLIAAGLSWCTTAASAGDPVAFPQNTVTIVVPFAPGGSPDQLARLLGQRLAQRWGNPVVVENRPGAGGNIAAQAVARAAADGHTLLMGTDGPLAINPSIYAAMPYDVVRDFAPVGEIATVDFVLVAAPTVPVADLREFITFAANANPPMAYGSSGIGSQHHLGMETFGKSTGIELRHVPYKGVAGALADVMGSHIPTMFAAVPAAASLIQTGKIKALAVTGRERSSMLPDVPTMSEAGVDGFELKAWFGLVAPARTPGEIIEQIHRDLGQVLSEPEVRAALEAGGFTITGGTPQAFAQLIASEQERWAQAARLAGVTAQ